MQFDVLDRITALGPVKYLVALTRMHVWRLEEWHQLFPDAELWGPPQIPNKFQALPFAGILGEVPPNGWADDLDQPAFEDNLFIDEVFFIHKKSRTVILADFIQNRPITKGEPFLNALYKLAGVAYPGGVAVDIRLSFTNRKLARQSLEKLLSWDFDKLIIADGVCIEKDGKPFVERAFRWLGRSTVISCWSRSRVDYRFIGGCRLGRLAGAGISSPSTPSHKRALICT